MGRLRVMLACLAASAMAGCATLPDYREDPVTTAEIVRHIKCELRDAVWAHPENAWVRPWKAALNFEFEVTHTGGLDSDNTWVFPLNQGATFILALTGGFSGQGTRTERMNFIENLQTINTQPLFCPKQDPDRHARLGGELGLTDLLERVGLAIEAANINIERKLLTQLDYNLQFIIKKNASLTPKFNLIPIGKEKPFTGSLKWTGSSSDTQTLKLVLTPPASTEQDQCDLALVNGKCPAPVYDVTPEKKVSMGKKQRGKSTGEAGPESVEQPVVGSRGAAPSAPRSGISDADRENLDRARARNVLDSIEGQLRRQGIGN
jgi:hypothetical protein